MKSAPLNKTFQEMTAVFDEMLASLSTLQSLGSLHLGSLGEGQLLREALVSLVENYGVERCALFFMDSQQECPVVAVDWKDGALAVCIHDEHRPCEKVSAIESAFVDRAVKQGGVQVCDDCLADPVLQLLAEGEGYSPRSLLCTPLASDGEMLGVLLLSASEPERFGTWQQRFIPLFALFLGQALMSSRLLHRLENEVCERTLRLEKVLQETQELKQHYQMLSLVDPLTGLYNRRFFFSEGSVVVARAVRYQHPASFMILDLDGFKRINDRFGHVVGDQVLKDVADALRGQLRESDALARIGGEEFALVLPETGSTGALDLAERLLQAVRSLSWTAAGRPFRITISAGVAALASFSETSDRPGLTHDELLDQLFSCADQALYAAKEQGGDKVLGGDL